MVFGRALGLPPIYQGELWSEGRCFFFRELRSRDYDSLEGELRHTDGCSHVMPGFTLVSNKRGGMCRDVSQIWDLLWRRAAGVAGLVDVHVLYLWLECGWNTFTSSFANELRLLKMPVLLLRHIKGCERSTKHCTARSVHFFFLLQM